MRSLSRRGLRLVAPGAARYLQVVDLYLIKVHVRARVPR